MGIHDMRTNSKNEKANEKTIPAGSSARVRKQVMSPGLQLQQHLGNQAAQRLLNTVQIQAKFTVGKSNNKCEREADRVADQVMRITDTEVGQLTQLEDEDENVQLKPLDNQIPPLVQRQEDMDEEEAEELLQVKEKPGQTPEVSQELESSINSLRGGGQALPNSIRNYMEPRFGQDFSQVRIHTDTKTAKATHAINAKAFTIGRDIAFGTGEYQPQIIKGKRLIAHELTHVVQQQTMGNHAIQMKSKEMEDSGVAAASAARILASPPLWLATLIAMIDNLPDAGTGMVKHSKKGTLRRKDSVTKKWSEEIELEEKERSEALSTIQLVRIGIDSLTAVGIGLKPDQHDAAEVVQKIKAELYAKLNAKTIYFSQKANADLVMTPAWKNTCNVTSMGMNLQAMGVKPNDFNGDKKKLLKIADNYAVNDPFSLRMPDFMQLVAIYNAPTLKGKKQKQFTRKIINAARIDAVVLGKDKYKITKAGTLKGLAKLFPVTAVTKFMTFPKKDEWPTTAKEKRAAVASYKINIQSQIQPHFDKGSQIEIALKGHWVRLQSFDKAGLIIDDPWTKGNNAMIPWNQAYSKKYGLAYIVISK